MSQIINTAFTYEPWPENLVRGPDIATQAGSSIAEAQFAIATAWAMAENYTRRTYRTVLTGVVTVEVDGISWVPWPRWPEPAAVTAELLASAFEWQPYEAFYLPGKGISLAGAGLYRLTQTGTVPAPTIPIHVLAAVQNLALYILVHAPHRREFKSQSAGDYSFTRENLFGLLYGSGAGPVLAGEVRL